MNNFVPKDQLGSAEFDKWVDAAGRRFWLSDCERKGSNGNAKLLRDYLTNKDLQCWGVREDENLGILVLAPCDWESSVIRRPAAKVLFMAADSYNIALILAEELQRYAIKQELAFISADPGISPVYLVCALERFGFHLAAQYCYWMAGTEDVVNIAKKYVKRYTLRFATPKDASSVASIAREAFVYGRYVADPLFPKNLGKHLYGEWAANSCRGYADAVIVYEKNKEICGFVAGKLSLSDHNGRVILLAVRKDTQHSGIGIVLLAKLFLWFAEQEVDTIRVGTERPNVEMNRIYRHFGFKIEDSGVVLHWCTG